MHFSCFAAQFRRPSQNLNRKSEPKARNTRKTGKQAPQHLPADFRIPPESEDTVTVMPASLFFHKNQKIKLHQPSIQCIHFFEDFFVLLHRCFAANYTDLLTGRDDFCQIGQRLNCRIVSAENLVALFLEIFHCKT